MTSAASGLCSYECKPQEKTTGGGQVARQLGKNRGKKRTKPGQLREERAKGLVPRNLGLGDVPEEELLPSFLLRTFAQGVPTSSGPGGLFQDQGAACRAAPARAQLPSAGLGLRYRGAHLRGRSWDVVLAS